MAERLHLEPRHRAILDALLREHLPDVEVWAYGSRVDGRSHDGSDLDLVLRGPGLEEIPIGQLGDFEEAVRESRIPFLVEARDWARLPKRFLPEIERRYVALVTPKPDSAVRYNTAPRGRDGASNTGAQVAWVGASVDNREQLREQLRSVAMGAGDSSEGMTASTAALNDAFRFVDLLPADARVLHVAVADDGEINFFRRAPGLFVDVGVPGDGHIHYYASADSLGIDVDGSQPIRGNALPRVLVIPLTTD